MTALMDKMYIKLDQKDVPYKPQIYQKRGRGQVILEEVVFEEGLILLLGETMIGIEIERTEDHGDSLDQEKEE